MEALLETSTISFGGAHLSGDPEGRVRSVSGVHLARCENACRKTGQGAGTACSMHADVCSNSTTGCACVK
eukprot:1159815-Pelagomonas_calceolata.AAC.13